MATPLSPLASEAINVRATLAHAEDDSSWQDPPSSPFVDVVDVVDQENTLHHFPSAKGTPTKSQNSPPNTPQKHQSPKKTPKPIQIHEDEDAKEGAPEPKAISEPPEEPPTIARAKSLRMSPVKQRMEQPASNDLRENEGLTVAARNWNIPPAAQIVKHEEEDVDNTIDDTCFSAFSEVHNTDMTMFAKLGKRSPTKQMLFDQTLTTPRPKSRGTPGTSRRRYQDERSPSPTPRGTKTQSFDTSDTTSLLLDFTEQMQSFSTARSRLSPAKGSPVKSQTESNLLSYINGQRTPGKSNRVPATPSGNKLLNLLDFELPPPATPRSVPTITIRELESMKSSFTSQISQLTASLSGKDATIDSLTKAITDAERRVGESQEAVREERAAREHAEADKAQWEKKGIEVEDVLRSIKKEIMDSEREREELFQKLEAAERRAEEAEAKASDAQAKTLEAEGKLVDASVFIASDEASSAPRFTAEEVQKQIDDKVETLCRELHLVYKKKHESKVAALKKSYEAKSEKKLVELQKRVTEQEKKIEELQVGKDATFSGVLPSDLPTAQHVADLKRVDAQKAEIEEQKAKLAGLQEEIRTVRVDHTRVLAELEKERVEKGELVAAAEQMMTLQAELMAQPEVVEDFRKSINKPSGLRAPAESRIGKFGSGKSRMMSNIERMGATRATE